MKEVAAIVQKNAVCMRRRSNWPKSTGAMLSDKEIDSLIGTASEQTTDTKSRWAQMARSGKNVMQFLS
ncbi:MAG: hypothetical protein AUG89_05020 [Acidobacteria bacterium 13_1_20CM_4_56_7]|nr:MAG: hypothetical protein AUG89_05020 [Acidobacteria bacterium 13_1_20CM_4_56_7]